LITCRELLHDAILTMKVGLPRCSRCPAGETIGEKKRGTAVIAQLLNRQFVLEQMEAIEAQLMEDVSQQRYGGAEASSTGFITMQLQQVEGLQEGRGLVAPVAKQLEGSHTVLVAAQARGIGGLGEIWLG
jgi:hypothetical protein